MVSCWEPKGQRLPGHQACHTGAIAGGAHFFCCPLAVIAMTAPACGICSQVKLEFPASEDVGSHEYTLYLMSDSYLGCDQVYEFGVNVAGDGDVETA